MRVNFIANSSLYFSERKYISPPYVIIPNQTCARVIFPPYRIIYPFKIWEQYLCFFTGIQLNFICGHMTEIVSPSSYYWIEAPLFVENVYAHWTRIGYWSDIVKANHYVCESNESSSAFSALWWYKIVTNMNVRIGGKPINYVGTQLFISWFELWFHFIILVLLDTVANLKWKEA